MNSVKSVPAPGNNICRIHEFLHTVEFKILFPNERVTENAVLPLVSNPGFIHTLIVCGMLLRKEKIIIVILKKV